MYTKITFLKNKLILIIPNTINKCIKHTKSVYCDWQICQMMYFQGWYCKQVFVFWLTFASTQAYRWHFSCLQNCLYVTHGSHSDGGSRFLIHAIAHQKYRSQKCMDVRCTTSVRISEDLIWWRPVILTSWQSKQGKSPWIVFYVRTSS